MVFAGCLPQEGSIPDLQEPNPGHVQQYTDVLQHVWKQYNNVCTSLDLTVSDVSTSRSPSCLNLFPWEGRYSRWKGQAGWKEGLSSGSFLPQAHAVTEGQAMKDYSCSSKAESSLQLPVLLSISFRYLHTTSKATISKNMVSVKQSTYVYAKQMDCLGISVWMWQNLLLNWQRGKHTEEHVFSTKELSDEHCSPVTVIAHKNFQLVVLQVTMGFRSVRGCENSSCYLELTNLCSLPRAELLAAAEDGFVLQGAVLSGSPSGARFSSCFARPLDCATPFPALLCMERLSLALQRCFLHEKDFAERLCSWWKGWVKVAVPLVLGDILLYSVSECYEHCTSTSLLENKSLFLSVSGIF